METRIVSQDKGICRIKLVGEVIQRHLRKFSDPIEAAGGEIYGQKVICDCSETKMLDSAGVSWILITHKRCREAGGRLVLHSLSQLVLNVILVLRLNLIFDIADNESQALKLASQSVAEEPSGTATFDSKYTEESPDLQGNPPEEASDP